MTEEQLDLFNDLKALRITGNQSTASFFQNGLEEMVEDGITTKIKVKELIPDAEQSFDNLISEIESALNTAKRLKAIGIKIMNDFVTD